MVTVFPWSSYGFPTVFPWFFYGFPPFSSWTTRLGDLRAPMDLAGDVGPDPAAAQQLAGEIKDMIFLGITGNHWESVDHSVGEK